MTDLNALTNITPLEMNNSIVTEGDIIPNFITQVNTVIPWWFFTSMIVLYLVLMWYVYKKQEMIRLDLMQTHLFSTFFVSVISFAIVISGISNSIVPLTFFGLLWLLALLGMYYVKKRG